jgi:hypothetical protein
MSGRDGGSRPDDDRLICLADALALVPFSETTLRRAISRGDLEASQPNPDGKLVIWRSALFAWATRRPAQGDEQGARRAERRPARRSPSRRRRVVGPPEAPEPIRLPIWRNSALTPAAPTRRDGTNSEDLRH